jgi:hypothetical protein
LPSVERVLRLDVLQRRCLRRRASTHDGRRDSDWLAWCRKDDVLLAAFREHHRLVSKDLWPNARHREARQPDSWGTHSHAVNRWSWTIPTFTIRSRTVGVDCSRASRAGRRYSRRVNARGPPGMPRRPRESECRDFRRRGCNLQHWPKDSISCSSFTRCPIEGSAFANGLGRSRRRNHDCHPESRGVCRRRCCGRRCCAGNVRRKQCSCKTSTYLIERPLQGPRPSCRSGRTQNSPLSVMKIACPGWPRGRLVRGNSNDVKSDRRLISTDPSGRGRDPESSGAWRR